MIVALEFVNMKNIKLSEKIKERNYEQKFRWHRKQSDAQKSKKYCVFGFTHLHIGIESKHKLDANRRLRCLNRLKANRLIQNLAFVDGYLQMNDN